MPSSPDGQSEFHRSSCICPNYDLRITERCLVEDLQLTVDACFEEAMSRPIVKAFVAKRQQVPFSGKTVFTTHETRTLYHLGVGNDHRGATWHDTVNTAVWLCGYGLHRSGEPLDAFQKFKHLIENGRIYPAQADYRRLILDRGVRFVETAAIQATALREAAIADPGNVHAGIIGYRVPIRITAYVSPGLADLTVAFSPANLNRQQINFVVSSFAPGQDAEIDITDTLGGMPLLTGEIAFQIMTRV